MTYNFNTELAEKYGVDEAIIYQNIEYWCIRKRANKETFGGHAWVYNSLDAWVELFPFWSKDKIFRTLKKMIEKGMIEKSFSPSKPFDRTSYYRPLLHIADSQNGYCNNAKSDFADSQNVHIADSQNDYKGTVIKHNNKPVIKHSERDDAFNCFYDEYPKHVGKQQAVKTWNSLWKKNLLPPINEIVEYLKEKKETDWKGMDKTFIKNPSTWLNSYGWEDEIISRGNEKVEDNRSAFEKYKEMYG